RDRDPHAGLRQRPCLLGRGGGHRRGLGSGDGVGGDPEQGPRAVAGGRARGAGASMIAVIDNYDSFTYNLVQYLGTLGAQLEVWRNDAITGAALKTKPLEGLVISPGPGEPRAAGVSEDAIRALAGTVPILGVCLGHQALGEV